MTEATHARIPQHLRKYIVDQNYGRYTPEDQAVWRYIMRQLKNFLSKHAHESYLDGLVKTGISIDRIPSIDEIDAHLERFGWGAVPVSGFIPPAAFMEFQSIGVLPIASDMRALGHLLYTPAPDIVHEAAGHAPILIHPEYAAYLKQYGAVARNTIISKEDVDQYEAIRILSDIKEDPRSTAEDIEKANQRLNDVTSKMKHTSEAALLSRMNWWTAEYGLIGDVKSPRIFGAGLLSSVGESRSCLSSAVKKIPLSVECVNYTYDITEPQPQLFVTRDFNHLGQVLEDLAATLSFKKGGLTGLQRAKEAASVNTVQLNSGLQISGELTEYLLAEDGRTPIHLRFSGPCQLALNGQQIKDQGTAQHPEGYSSPLGDFKSQSPLKLDERNRLEFQSGIVVEGRLKNQLHHADKLVLLTFGDCKVTRGSTVLFDPSWGVYDMAVGSTVVSVFGGPADRSHYGKTEDFAAQRVPAKNFSPKEKERHEFFAQLRQLRETGGNERQYQTMVNKFLQQDRSEWLPGIELLEISYQLGLSEKAREPVLARLRPENFDSPLVRQSVADGLALAESRL